MADVNTGSNAVLRMEAWVNWQDNVANNASFHWKLTLIERTASVYGWNGGMGASVEIRWDGGAGYHVPWSGSFSFDFRPGGQQSKVIAEGDIILGNYSDGTPRTFTFQGNIANSGTSTVGGPTSVAQNAASGYTKVAPPTPYNMAAARVSDTQINLSWAQSPAANGAPQNNDLSRSVNGGAWEDNFVVLSYTNSATVGAAPNQKVQYRVRGWNPWAGHSGWSGASAPIYTTPGAPSNAAAAKGSGLDIQVTWQGNVAYAEHTHEIQHGTVLAGVTTWDSGIIAEVPAGIASWAHTAPDSGQVHTYRVRAKAAGLTSAWSTANSVQLLVAPNAPTIPAMPTFADKAQDLVINWNHNPIDTTPQTAYQISYSYDGGSTWAEGGKTTTPVSSNVVPANTHPANTAMTYRVRTWGSATSGGSDGTGASPWSELRTVTFKTRPTTSIVEPANGSTLNDATVRATMSFAQSEGAVFVKARMNLTVGSGGPVLEALESSVLTGITFATQLQNGASYDIGGQVQDSNGLWSDWVAATFDVDYLAPVSPTVTPVYLPEVGFGQIALVFPAPGAGEDEAELVTITRTINGVTEDVLREYPVESELTIFDTTPTIHGTNTYTVTVTSPLGAQTSVTADLVTEECRRAFLSKGASFNRVGVFGGNLKVDETLGVSSTTVQAAGRTKPIGLYGVETSVELKVSSYIFEGFGSTRDDLRDLLLLPGKACFRDATGRRTFGSVKGGVAYTKTTRGELNFTMTETS